MVFKDWLEDVTGRRVYRRYFEKEDRTRRVTAQIVSIAGALLTIVYLAWVATVLNLGLWWLSIPFYAAEVAGLFIFASFSFVTWYPRFHRPQGILAEPTYTVDVFVTVCGEPYELVARTASAAAAIAYPRKAVYLLDDKADARIQALATELGVGYFARGEPVDAKAGNLNHALRRTQGDLVLTLAADQAPSRDIVSKTIGYFKYSYIGFVQTKQVFRVPKGDPFCNGDPIFYNVMQPGKDTYNAVFSCGSGVIYRRQALEEAGGFSTWNVVEDLHTSMLLHSRGWRSVYHNHPLTAGTAPVDIWGVYRQRQQWATDSLRMFFWDSPFTKRGLSPRQKLQYAHIGFVYLFAGFVMPLFYLIPIVSLLAGRFVIEPTLLEYLFFRGPSVLVTIYAYKRTAAPTPYYRAMSIWLGYFPSFIYAAFLALVSRKRKPGYTVTPKARDPGGWLTRSTAVAPQLLLILLSVVAIVYGWVQRTGTTDVLLINTIWALATIDKLRHVCAAPFAVPTDVNGGRRTELTAGGEI